MARKITTTEQKKHGAKLCQKIQELRKQKNMTQAELADKSKLPLDTIRALENRRITSPNIFAIFQICQALNYNLHRLMKEVSL